MSSAWLSGLTSLLVPGWGQILNGQLRKGLFFLLAFVTQIWLLAFYLMTPPYRVVSELDPNQALLRNVIQVGKLVLVGTAILWLISVYDAVRSGLPPPKTQESRSTLARRDHALTCDDHAAVPEMYNRNCCGGATRRRDDDMVSHD